MKILLIGARGRLAKRLINLIEKDSSLELIKFDEDKSYDATNAAQIKEKIDGIDVIVSVIGARSVEDFVEAGRTIISVAKDNNIRLVWAGGAGSLVQKDGKRMIDAPSLPPEWSAAVYGQDIIRKEFEKEGNAFAWSLSIPPVIFRDDENATEIKEIKATGQALYNDKGIPMGTYISGAKVLFDEIKDPKFINQVFTWIEK